MVEKKKSIFNVLKMSMMLLLFFVIIPSKIAIAAPETRLDTPRIYYSLHESATGNPIVEWADVEYADKYQVWRATSKTGKYSNVSTTKDIKYVDKNAKSGVTYYYKVVAVYSKDTRKNSEYSNTMSGKKVKADTKLSKAIKNSLKNGKYKKVSTFDDSLNKISDIGIEYLSYYNGGFSAHYNGKLSVTKVFEADEIAAAGGTLELGDNGSSPFGGGGFLLVQKNGIKYDKFYGDIYAMNLLRVREGSSQSEINKLIKETVRKYYSEKNWAVTSGKYDASKKRYSSEIKEAKQIFNDHLKTAGYSKYKNNVYFVRIKNKNNAKKQGWIFVTAVPTLKRLSKPTVTLTNLKSTDNIKISWKKVSKANKYEVWRKTGSNGTYKKLTTTTKRTYTDKKTTTGKKYYYKVKAIKTANSTLTSKFSSSKYIKCK